MHKTQSGDTETGLKSDIFKAHLDKNKEQLRIKPPFATSFRNPSGSSPESLQLAEHFCNKRNANEQNDIQESVYLLRGRLSVS